MTYTSVAGTFHNGIQIAAKTGMGQIDPDIDQVHLLILLSTLSKKYIYRDSPGVAGNHLRAET
jgi:hypothetical protein